MDDKTLREVIENTAFRAARTVAAEMKDNFREMLHSHNAAMEAHKPALDGRCKSCPPARGISAAKGGWKTITVACLVVVTLIQLAMTFWRNLKS